MKESELVRVLIMVDGMPSGGTERQIVELLKGMKRSYPQVCLLLCVLVKGGLREEEASRYAYEVVYVPQKHKYNISLAWSLLRVVRKKNIDILHTFGSISDLSGAMVRLLTGVKLINGSIRNARQKPTLRDRASKFAMQFADEIVANSSAGLVAYGVNNKTNVRVIYNGVDFSRFDDVEPFRKGRPYICMVGNFTHKKDQLALIHAFSHVANAYPEYDLVLVGRGEQENKCRDLAGKLALDDKILFVNKCDAPEPYIIGGDICVLLSPDGEGLSNVIIEYFACAKPVIASNLGGNSEIICDGETGILLETHSIEEVSKAISDLLSNRVLNRSYGDSGREYVMRKFTLDRMVTGYFKLYESLAQKQ